MVTPANENKKKCAVQLLHKAVEKVRVEAVICDKKYQARR
jgi:hypothetical protein